MDQGSGYIGSLEALCSLGMIPFQVQILITALLYQYDNINEFSGIWISQETRETKMTEILPPCF